MSLSRRMDRRPVNRREVSAYTQRQIDRLRVTVIEHDLKRFGLLSVLVVVVASVLAGGISVAVLLPRVRRVEQRVDALPVLPVVHVTRGGRR